MHVAPFFLPAFKEAVKEDYQGWWVLYTDGSKTDRGVAAAVAAEGVKVGMTLPRMASIFTAEIHAIRLALKEIGRAKHDRYLICSDSLSSVMAIENPAPRNHLVQRLQGEISTLITACKTLAFMWIPGHSGIEGNNNADETAKRATAQPPQFITIPYTDWYPYIRTTTYQLWAERWRLSTSPLKRIKLQPGKWKRGSMSRREEVILNRLRVAHTRITHNYLFND